jgi:hypothetical protein
LTALLSLHRMIPRRRLPQMVARHLRARDQLRRSPTPAPHRAAREALPLEGGARALRMQQPLPLPRRCPCSVTSPLV